MSKNIILRKEINNSHKKSFNFFKVLKLVRHKILKTMLSVVSGNTGGAVAMERLRGGAPGRGGGGPRHHHHQHQLQVMVAAQRDRAVRLHSVHTDLELDLPPSIALPDGEEHPYGTSARLKLRDSEQESEIYQKCIRPPPNRTVFESESPPPYRSSSAGLLGSLGSSTSSTNSGCSGTSVGNVNDWSTGGTPLVVRCHSMSSGSTSKRTDSYHHTTHHHAHHQTSCSAPPSSSSSTATKSDFLQRTVKIFTGKKFNNQSSTSNSQLISTHHSVPCVVVPTSRTHRQPITSCQLPTQQQQTPLTTTVTTPTPSVTSSTSTQVSSVAITNDTNATTVSSRSTKSNSNV